MSWKNLLLLSVSLSSVVSVSGIYGNNHDLEQAHRSSGVRRPESAFPKSLRDPDSASSRFQDKEWIEKCSNKIPRAADRCITVLSICSSHLLQDKNIIIQKSGSTPCSARAALQEEACHKGIDLSSEDITCRPQ